MDLERDIMVYPDDLACYRGDVEIVKRLVMGYVECLEEAGCKMNVEKTVIMSVGRDEGEETTIVNDIESVKIWISYVLGRSLTKSGRCLREIEEIIYKIWSNSKTVISNDQRPICRF